MRALGLLAAAALALALALPAEAGHSLVPVPDGAIDVRLCVVFCADVVDYAPAPFDFFDGYWAAACAATQGTPDLGAGPAASCTYYGRACSGGWPLDPKGRDLQVFCDPFPVPVPPPPL